MDTVNGGGDPSAVQRRNFAGPGRMLKKNGYENLVHTARKKGGARRALHLETMAATGARLSEVQAMTAGCLRVGKTEIIYKSERKIIVLLENYAKYCSNVEKP